MIVFPDVALPRDLDAWVGGIDPWYHLFTNDFRPDRFTVLSNLTEATADGYGPLEATHWAPAAMEGTQAVARADPLFFDRSDSGPAQLVYGYFVTDGETGPLLWCERARRTPLLFTDSTTPIIVAPTLALGPCVPPPDHGGDSVGDGGATAGPPPGLGLGDSVGDGAGVVPPGPGAGLGDSVGDGGATLGPPLGHGLGDSVGDGGATAGPPPGLGLGDSVGDGEGVGS